MMYADDYDSKFPTTKAGANPVNMIRGGYYTRWMWFDSSYQGYKVPQSWTQIPLTPRIISRAWECCTRKSWRATDGSFIAQA